MGSELQDKVIKLSDYKAPNFTIEKVELEFNLDETETIIKSKIYVVNNSDKEFFLNGSTIIRPIDVKIAGVVPEHDFDLDGNLTIFNAPSDFVLELIAEINPSTNTTCMGLYMSEGMFTTQCEAEGFREITYYPDRPDVLSKFTVTINADADKFNTWLSNGNLISRQKLEDGRMQSVWEDPFPKPAYLFALVVGNLGHIGGTFTTESGRKVDLNLYCEKGKEDKLGFALEALKKSMRWDEEKFGREYDLDIFNIVAVSHFIFGAMENKSLNIFNDSCLLADKDSATDYNYQRIAAIIAHEYFHNWSGNRVTLNSWFELSLKEGFTVYRDQLFTADQYSETTKRISDASDLRNYQFPDDNGPLSHPVRAEEYVSINNFYTSTVYEKGAEIVRMYEKLLGWGHFREACDLYFDRFDGKAVTINDFAACMEEVSGKDLTQFKRWYSQNGTPTVFVETKYSDDIFSIYLKQSQEKFREPLVIPLEYGLINKEGEEVKSGTVVLDKKEQVFNFDGIESGVVLSINRGFTAPVKIDIEYSQDEIETLIKHDSDLFNRYDIGQKYALDNMLQDRVDSKFIEVFGSYLDLFGGDNEFISQAIALPGIKQITDYMSVINYDKVIAKHREVSKLFANTHKERLLEIYKVLDVDKEYSLSNEDIGARSLKSIVLYYLCLAGYGKDFALNLYKKSNNLTDRIMAIASLRHEDILAFDECMDDFYEKNKKNNLVVLKWLGLYVTTKRDDILAKVKELLNHEAFDMKNPNTVRVVLGGFSSNLEYFHAKDGSGYEFIADKILEIDEINPSVAAMMAHAFNQLQKLDETRKNLMSAQVKKILSSSISSNLREILEKIIVE